MTNQEKWEKNINYLKRYKEEFGDCDVPKSYAIDDFKLGTWVYALRQAYIGQGTYKLTDERIEELDKLGFKWNIRHYSWDKNYKVLEKYYKLHNNIDVPVDYEIFGYNLGFWLANQKQLYSKKKKKYGDKIRIKKLNLLEIDWNKNDTYLLNRNINSSNKVVFYKTLNKRINSVLDDLIFEGKNRIDSLEKHDELNKEIIKRVFR